MGCLWFVTMFNFRIISYFLPLQEIKNSHNFFQFLSIGNWDMWILTGRYAFGKDTSLVPFTLMTAKVLDWDLALDTKSLELMALGMMVPVWSLIKVYSYSLDHLHCFSLLSL